MSEKPITLTGSLLAGLALLSAAGPFSIDMYLPGLPQLGRDLATTNAQLTLSGFMIGMATGQLIIGVLSDTFGRKRFIVSGAALALITSLLCAIAPNIGILIAARFLQGLGSGACVVLARSVIPDITSGVTAAKAFSWMGIISGIAPAAAPVLGSLLVSSLGWRGIFYVLAGIAAAQLLVALFVIPETRPPADRTPLSFGFASMFAYISASSFVMQEIMGFSPQIFALVFGTNALGLMVGGALNTRLLDRFPAAAILKIALIIMTVAATIVLVCALTGLPRIPFFLALFFAVMPLSLVMGNATALAVAAVRTRAGSASSVMGFGQFLLAGLVSPLVGMVGGSQAVGMGVCMVGAAVVAVMMFVLARRAD
ncbi:MAG: multidrug effflux MFS transporter [Corynebacterium matruchotii]|uniref:multidrug effflux MFS transporter n=1 Tax=Corynebacterium matruchotii TaxID=43768 RepID=UPI00361F0E36